MTPRRFTNFRKPFRLPAGFKCRRSSLISVKNEWHGFCGVPGMQYAVRILLVAVITFASREMARANNLSLAWNPSPSAGLAGYSVYYGTTSGSYSYQIDAGNATSATISNLTAGTTYYIATTAYNVLGNESSFSNEISYTVPAASAPATLAMTSASDASNPASVQFLAQTGYWYEVQATADLVNWTSIWQSDVFPADTYMDFTDSDAGLYSSRFYRLVTH
jgi:hypothetical protein